VGRVVVALGHDFCLARVIEGQCFDLVLLLITVQRVVGGALPNLPHSPGGGGVMGVLIL
jgi:hypothetical protein